MLDEVAGIELMDVGPLESDLLSEQAVAPATAAPRTIAATAQRRIIVIGVTAFENAAQPSRRE
ncbi:hypothetical protein [Nocardia pseudobrasiliensis]|uniref:hypothetical protein n=1 Tax=Nocardia pseudobrasiliensis TaxID=45979 RepID=UPI001FE48436|nr:hypothetical protein [Nocardia pseudobrasiliensis]